MTDDGDEDVGEIRTMTAKKNDISRERKQLNMRSMLIKFKNTHFVNYFYKIAWSHKKLDPQIKLAFQNP